MPYRLRTRRNLGLVCVKDAKESGLLWISCMGLSRKCRCHLFWSDRRLRTAAARIEGPVSDLRLPSFLLRVISISGAPNRLYVRCAWLISTVSRSTCHLASIAACTCVPVLFRTLAFWCPVQVPAGTFCLEAHVGGCSGRCQRRLGLGWPF